MTAAGEAGPEVDADAQTVSDTDQSTADRDQSEADLDQSAADAEQQLSEQDQVASDRDQAAADRDQQASDSAQDAGAKEAEYERSRRARLQSAVDRDHTTESRTDTARTRDETAARRDRSADARDDAARARDRLAATLDSEIERLETAGRLADETLPAGGRIAMRAAIDRRRAAENRAHAAAQREAAARDRERSAEDRRQAARDREAAAVELALEGIDNLTGALHRRVGLDAMQREMDRAGRSGESLVVAFVDVDGLKAVNDTQGHQAGDELLRAVARSIMKHLRSYDVISRFGGDEFVCLLTGKDVAQVDERFAMIARHLADSASGASFTVGLAERRTGESLDDLVRRADGSMLRERSR